MDTVTTTNAVITGTMLGEENHGILTAWIYLEFASGGQGFGGYALDGFVASGASKHVGTRVGSAAGMEFIRRLMLTVGVSKWEDLKGSHVRIKHTHDHVAAIGHIIKHDWLVPEEVFGGFDPMNFCSKIVDADTKANTDFEDRADIEHDEMRDHEPDED